MSGRASHKAAVEKAVEFVGVCPACGDFPEGPWTNVGEFECQCGVSLYANLDEPGDGAKHWRFTFAFEDEYQAHRLASRSPQKNRRP